MYWHVIEGNWTAFKGRIREKWGKLTNDEADCIAGRKSILIGNIQGCYHLSAEEAELQLATWQSGIGVGIREAP